MNKRDALVPRDLLKTVQVKGYCWVCDTHQDGQDGSHGVLRDNGIAEALEIEELTKKEVESLECDERKELFPMRKLFWHHVEKHLAQ